MGVEPAPAGDRLIDLCAAVLLGGTLTLVLLASLPVGPAQAALQMSGASTVVTYTSSVDGATLNYSEYLPAGYNPALSSPVVVMLPSAGGVIYQYDYALSPWRPAADAHGYLLATVQPRFLPGFPGSRQTFYIDGPLLPGEQDVLDALPVIAARHRLDPLRIYLAGYSMGGMGTLKLATVRPGLFAAAAPGAPAADLLQASSYLTASTAPDLATVLGGPPGQSALIDTYWLENSPRFLLSNLMHTPVYIVHGKQDTLLPNDTSVWPFMQSRHVVDTPGFVDGRGRTQTLDELQALWPGDYFEQHLWPAASHGGAQAFWLPDDVLTFFDEHPLVSNPLDISFSTYDNRHNQAYWLRLDLVRPWTAVAGSVIVSRAPAANTVRLRAMGSVTITLDLPAMDLNPAQPLTVVVQPISSAVASDAALVLSGTWPVASNLLVTRDGVPLAAGAFGVAGGAVTVLRQPVSTPHTYVITPVVDALVKFFLPLLRR